MPEPTHALSLKQPWAALLVHGRKSIEVRNWPTPRRGRFFIHAARIPDMRDEAWQHVTPEVRVTVEYVGGIIGIATLIDCKTYESLDQFAADRTRHLNESAWFQPPKMFGFVFANMEVRPYRRLPGWMRFFPVGQSSKLRGFTGATELRRPVSRE
jgi:hypothetical protein